MDNKIKKVSSPESGKQSAAEFYYLSESVKDYNFADFVRINSFHRGMILSFGKMQPDERKFSIFQEILLPFEVADSLSKIIKKNMDELIEKGALKKISPEEEGGK